MKSRLTIKGRIAFAMGLLGALLIAVSVLGLVGTSSATDATYDVFSNNLPGAIATGNAAAFVLRERVVLDRAALEPDSPDVGATLERARKYRGTSNQWWDRYLALPRDGDENELAKKVTAARQHMYEAIDRVIDAIKSRDAADIRAKTSALTAPYVALGEATDALTDFQSRTAKASYDKARKLYVTFRAAAIAMMLLGASAAVLSWVTLRRAIARPLDNALEHFRAISAGDLSRPVHITSNDEMGEILSGLSTMRDALRATVRTVLDGSEAIAQATREIAAGNLDLSARTEEQAASLQQTAAGMEELTGTVRQNADNAGHGSKVAGDASNIASRGSEVVNRVVGTMSEISDSSSKIADIIGIIEGIAFQTNILALNAAVEAARAGEQGRGFAVVAGEVRALAQRSSSAAKEIKQLIDTSASRVQAGSAFVDQASTAMHEIIGSVSQVSEIMAGIATASSEQRTGIDQVALAVTQMDTVTQQNAALVEQAAAAAQSLEVQAARLKEAVAAFKLDV
ncbi:methyl-accepting chemotaxis protein [Trinickia sp. LjRoot230]|uniref:methyl-accepting chemotaxis protein n=1 Tax=Trinickia sp. LjRoot230 TaxID=3342288 RepID=UPI003F50BDE8